MIFWIFSMISSIMDRHHVLLIFAGKFGVKINALDPLLSERSTTPWPNTNDAVVRSAGKPARRSLRIPRSCLSGWHSCQTETLKTFIISSITLHANQLLPLIVMISRISLKDLFRQQSGPGKRSVKGIAREKNILSCARSNVAMLLSGAFSSIICWGKVSGKKTVTASGRASPILFRER